MYEVEIKVRADHASVRSRLTDLDANCVGSVTQTDTYYDAPHRDFGATDEALRTRHEVEDDDERVQLTYKGPLVEAESKTRQEHETGVDDPEATARILDGLGFEPAAEVRKERERYELEGYSVTLDTVDGLGEFVEVETESDDADVEREREGARELLDSLGLDPDAQIRTSYLGLLLETGAD